MPSVKSRFLRKDLKFRMEPYNLLKFFKKKHSKELQKSGDEREKNWSGVKNPYKNMTLHN